MDVFVREGLDLNKENMMQKRIALLERQLEQLKEICIDLYRVHSYELPIPDNEYKEKWDKARCYCAKIESNSWDESKDILKLYKAQACCYLGTIYKEKGDYDEALKHLNKSRNYIEEQSAQNILPECYVRTCMGLAKCYMEKHSPSNTIDECHQCAREILEEWDSQKERFKKISLELKLQEIIAKLDIYGQNQNSCLNQVWPLIQEVEDEKKQILEKYPSNDQDKKWEQKIDATLITTKADFFKKMYYKLGDEKLQKQKIYFEKAFATFAEVIRGDKDNTIALGNIAALLYDYNEKTKDEAYLFGLLREHFSHFDDLPQTKILDVIHYLLDKTLDIEFNNMFALNIKAALSGENRMFGKINHYQALRQSSLKRRFKDLRRAVGMVCPDRLRSIMVNLIILHSQASEFMDAAIIDFSDPEWKKLEVGHYTRLEVLPKLINKDADSRLRIQNVHHLNDPMEGVLFVDLLRKAFGKEGEEKSSVIGELLGLYGSEKNGTVRNSVYMGSFTSRLDQLNMWAQYGDGGKGCSLQVDAARSFDNSARVSLAGISTDEGLYSYKMDDTKYPLYMVVYLPVNNTEELEKVKEYAISRAATDKRERKWWEGQAKLIEKLMELRDGVTYTIRKIDEDFREIYKILGMDERQKALCELCNIIMVILDLVRFLIKSDHYSDEREYRIIQYSSDPEYDDSGSGMPKLYIPVEKALAYKKICFGPLVQNFDSQAAYVLNIKKGKQEGKPKETWKLKVCKSSIDYR